MAARTEDDRMQTVRKLFARPPVGYRPVAFWFWNADPMKKPVIAAQLRDMKRQGMGGVAPFALHGGATPYAEEPWYDLWNWMARYRPEPEGV